MPGLSKGTLESAAGLKLGGSSFVGGRTPTNTKVAVLGDSIPYGNGFATNTYTKLYAKGYVNWAAFLGRQRWTFDNEDNFGVAGDTTTEVLARTNTALQTTAGTVIIDCLTNDEANNVSFAQSKLNYQEIINRVLAAGKIAVLITPRPRDRTASGLTMTANQLLQHLARRDYVLSLQNPGLGIYVVDMWRYLADPASINGAMKTNYSYDGVHPSVYGGYWGGVALAELFGTGRGPGLFPFRDVMVAQNSDVWSATYPRGCVNTNPMVAGGTTAATGYTVGGGSGATATGSKVTNGDRTDVQQVVLGGTATANADAYDFYQTLSAGNLTIGDTLRALVDIDYVSIGGGLTSHGLMLVDTSDFTKHAAFLTDSTDINALAMPNLTVSGVMRTPTLTIGSTTIRCGMKSRLINGAAVSATYRINAMAVRKIV